MSDMEEATDPVAGRVARNRWFWLLLFRPGPDRDQDEETAERIQQAHLAHLFELEATGRLCLFGPVVGAEDLRGIGVLTVPTRAEAEALVARDPAVQARRLVLEVRPWFTLPGGSLPLDGASTPDGAAVLTDPVPAHDAPGSAAPAESAAPVER